MKVTAECVTRSQCLGQWHVARCQHPGAAAQQLQQQDRMDRRCLWGKDGVLWPPGMMG